MNEGRWMRWWKSGEMMKMYGVVKKKGAFD